MPSVGNTKQKGTRTTPVLFPGKMNDLMTPALPSVGERVGKNGPGRPTAMGVFAVGSMSTARGERIWLWAARLLLDRKSIPFVSLFAAQLFAQLERTECQFSSEDNVEKVY